MVIFLLMLLILCLPGIGISLKNGYEDYLSPQKTGSVKGVFVIIVLLSHVRQYITADFQGIDRLYPVFLSFLGQLMVVMFLFYSGYGVFCGLRRKENYALSLIKSRIPKVWLHFALAVLIFFFTGLLLGRDYTIKKLLLSLTGFDGVGNSTWFVVIILFLYIITFLVFVFAKKKIIAGTVITTVLSVVLVLVMKHFKSNEYWFYDTIMCYPLGMWYAAAKPKIDKALFGNFGKWLACMAASVAVFFGLRELRSELDGSRTVFIFEAMVFALVIVFASMKINVNNRVLQWFGKRVFSIYILQRIPMIVLSHFGMNGNAFLFTAACFAITIVIAELFDRMTDRLDVALRLSKK